jgi:hypothetical protein
MVSWEGEGGGGGGVDVYKEWKTAVRIVLSYGSDMDILPFFLVYGSGLMTVGLMIFKPVGWWWYQEFLKQNQGLVNNIFYKHFLNTYVPT